MPLQTMTPTSRFSTFQTFINTRTMMARQSIMTSQSLRQKSWSSQNPLNQVSHFSKLFLLSFLYPLLSVAWLYDLAACLLAAYLPACLYKFHSICSFPPKRNVTSSSPIIFCTVGLIAMKFFSQKLEKLCINYEFQS